MEYWLTWQQEGGGTNCSQAAGLHAGLQSSCGAGDGMRDTCSEIQVRNVRGVSRPSGLLLWGLQEEGGGDEGVHGADI